MMTSPDLPTVKNSPDSASPAPSDAPSDATPHMTDTQEAAPQEKRALVLGGKTGLLGQALVVALQADGWQVSVAGRPEIDPLSPESLEAAFAEAAPTAVFNTIAYTKVDQAEDEREEAYSLNRSLPALVGRLARQCDAWLAHFSTDFVFNGKKTTAYTEDDAVDPLSVYGASKLAGEQVLLQTYPERSCIIRTSWLFGPGRKNFITTILDRCRCMGKISVVHDQIGTPTYTPDLAAAAVNLANLRATGIVNVANTGQASWCEFASQAVVFAGLKVPVEPITSADYPQKAVRPAYSVLSTIRYAELTGKLMRPWPRALQEYIFQLPPQDNEDHA